MVCLDSSYICHKGPPGGLPARIKTPMDFSSDEYELRMEEEHCSYLISIRRLPTQITGEGSIHRYQLHVDLI
jgi:hypothetical protein